MPYPQTRKLKKQIQNRRIAPSEKHILACGLLAAQHLASCADDNVEVGLRFHVVVIQSDYFADSGSFLTDPE